MASDCSFDYLVREIDDNLQLISRSRRRSFSTVCLLNDLKDSAYSSPAKSVNTLLSRSCNSEPARYVFNKHLSASAALENTFSADDTGLQGSCIQRILPGKGRLPRMRQRLDFSRPEKSESALR